MNNTSSRSRMPAGYKQRQTPKKGVRKTKRPSVKVDGVKVKLSKEAAAFCSSLCHPWQDGSSLARIPAAPLRESLLCQSRAQFFMQTTAAGQVLQFAFSPELAIMGDQTSGYWQADAGGIVMDATTVPPANRIVFVSGVTTGTLGIPVRSEIPSSNTRFWRVVSSGIRIRYIGERRFTAGEVYFAGWDGASRLALVNDTYDAVNPTQATTPVAAAQTHRAILKRMLEPGKPLEVSRGFAEGNDSQWKQLLALAPAGRTPIITVAGEGVAGGSYNNLTENACYFGFQAGPFPDIIGLNIDVICNYELTTVGPSIGAGLMDIPDTVGLGLVTTCHSKCLRAMAEDNSKLESSSILGKVMRLIPKLADVAFTSIVPSWVSAGVRAGASLLGGVMESGE